MKVYFRNVIFIVIGQFKALYISLKVAYSFCGTINAFISIITLYHIWIL